MSVDPALLAALESAVRVDPNSLPLRLHLAGLLLALVPPGYVAETLPNGLRVSIVADPTMPVVATQVWYHVGSANEDPHTRGFAHLFEHLMFGGTPSHPERAVWDRHEAFGGDVNASTAFDETVYVSEIPPQGHPGVIELEADRMVNLTLTPDYLANEQRIVTEELRLSTENDPFSRLYAAILKRVLDDHPYALTPVGTKEDIAAATLEHAREFYGCYYRPRNAHLIVVGPVDPQATLQRVRAAFGPLPADGITPPDVPDVYGWHFPAEVEFREDLPPVEIAALGFPLPAANAPDALALELLEQVLTASALDPVDDELVRKRHRAVFATAVSLGARRGGLIAFVSANLPYRRRATAFRHLDEVRQQLGRFVWLDESRLAAAKRKLLQADGQRSYLAATLADAIGSEAWWAGDERRAFDRAERLARVTLADVRGAYRRYVLEAKPVKLYVRPEHVPLYVRLFGWLYPLFRRG
ncbi:MAG TPA: pitrilysin family protein [Candidatus Polarisedimenticolaceae bacterium]|nr:pitrilysin family protein [Candidatus Polarisedimenticolaceae bacterium]